MNSLLTPDNEPYRERPMEPDDDKPYDRSKVCPACDGDGELETPGCNIKTCCMMCKGKGRV